MKTIVISSEGQFLTAIDTSRQVCERAVTLDMPFSEEEITDLSQRSGVSKETIRVMGEMIRRLECRRLGLKP